MGSCHHCQFIVWVLVIAGACCYWLHAACGGGWSLWLLLVVAVGSCSGWFSPCVRGCGLSLSSCACHVLCSGCGHGSLLWVFVAVHVGGL